ncbi:MAG TPA: aldo/keto reductase [Candidatus Dormibacteraeota bacterium]|nr:aldo/keto reductase [Candidatus Dormibacteraeota bacterium]
MNRVPLGRTNLQVTQLGLGSAPLGGLFEAVTDDEAHRTVEAAWGAGIRFYDTAPLYGSGLAERRLGAVLRTKPRDEFVLMTKVGRLLRADAPPDPDQSFKGTPPLNPVFDFSYDGVMRSVEESLERLGLDRVDVLLIHDPDNHHDEALSGAYRALDRLRSDGTITAVGAGMNQSEMLARFAREAGFDCFLLAGRYTLLDRDGARELLPLCLEHGIAVVAGGVFNSGILADPDTQPRFNYRPAPPQLVQRARALRAVCERHGVDIKAAALQFPLRHPAVAAVLIGPRSVAQLEENVQLFETPIPEGLWPEVDA